MDTKVKPKSASTAQHPTRFPGEGTDYRRAREKLLVAERELRKHVEQVAAARRQLPLGGPIPEDYVFTEGSSDLDDGETVRTVRFSELFVHKNASLAVYSFMYGPDMAKPCPMCSCMLDSLNGAAPHAVERINLAVVAKSPLSRIRAFARERGWRNLRLLSSAGNKYNRDYYGESADGSQLPSLNIFVRRGDKIHHFYHTELLFAPVESGQDARHVDMIWPLWNLFDFTAEGRGTDWYPKLNYGS